MNKNMTEFYTGNTPQIGMRRSARIFLTIFLTIFAACLIIFATLYIKTYVDYISLLNSSECAGIDPTNGLGQSFKASDLYSLAATQANITYGSEVVLNNPNLIESMKETILSKYTLIGNTYYYNNLPTFDCNCYLYLGLSIYFLFAAFIQTFALCRIHKAKYTEFYTIVVFLFMSLNIPSALLFIHSQKE